MPTEWKKVTSPSANLVQKHYVHAREEELNFLDNQYLIQQVEEIIFYRNKNEFSKLGLNIKKEKQWLEVYRTIEKNLQSAELTINFQPYSWFTTENNYDAYTQAYERAMHSDHAAGREGAIFVTEGSNKASTRVAVDDGVTLPKAWGEQKRERINPLPKSMQKRRGLLPGWQSGQRIKSQMEFGKFTDIKIGAESLNERFNAKTKQVFAALNYGRRPFGSTTFYGDAHLVLNPRFKLKALYYGMDTFEYRTEIEQGKFDLNAVQATYQNLGKIITTCKPTMLTPIIESCYLNKPLPNMEGTHLLLEAHLFEPVTFKHNIVAVRLPISYLGTKIADNARIFARKHGAKFTFVHRSS